LLIAIDNINHTLRKLPLPLLRGSSEALLKDFWLPEKPSSLIANFGSSSRGGSSTREVKSILRAQQQPKVILPP
jgi:hypothetical protein